MFDVTISRNLVLNVLIHILILFIFLYIFFFFFIAQTEESVINSQVDDFASKNVPKILKEIDDLDKEKVINWDLVKKKSQEIINDKSTDSSSSDMQKNNDGLKVIGLSIILSIFAIIVFVYLYFTYVAEKKVKIKKILLENVLVFVFIGIIEYYFFTTTASNYVPVYPNVVGVSILETIKNRIMMGI